MEKGKTAGIWIRVSTEDQVKWGKYHNAFQFLNIDDAGRIFVQTYERATDGSGYYYDVFDSEGKYIAKTSLKTTPRVRNIRGTHLTIILF